jgi:hypothetical protein
MATKKKRVLSAKQKAALAKGRAKMAAAWKHKTKRRKNFTKVTLSGTKKKRRKASHKRIRLSGGSPEGVIIMKGATMPRKRRSTRRKAVSHKRRSTRRYAGEVMGTSRKRRVHRRRARRTYLHGIGSGKNAIMKLIINGGIAAVGAVGGSFVASKIPLPNVKLKPFVPIAIGLALGMSKLSRKPVVQSLCLGLIAGGTLAAIKQNFPQLPTLAGDEELESYVQGEYLEDQSEMGIPENMGIVEDMSGAIESPADM